MEPVQRPISAVSAGRDLLGCSIAYHSWLPWVLPFSASSSVVFFYTISVPLFFPVILVHGFWFSQYPEAGWLGKHGCCRRVAR